MAPWKPIAGVEVAFASQPLAASQVYTDVSPYVEVGEGETIQWKRGRSYALESAQPGTMSLTLDNSDGRFNPDDPASPYYPNVKEQRRIRLRTAYPPNLIENPTAWMDTAHWGQTVSVTPGTISREVSNPPPGALTQIRWALAADAARTWAVLWADYHMVNRPWTGKVMTIRWSGKLISGTSTWQARLAKTDGTNVVWGPQSFTLTTSWQSFQWTFTAAGNADDLNVLYLTPTSATAAVTAEFGLVQLVPGDAQVWPGPGAPFPDLPVQYDHFVGLVDGWPKEWDGGVAARARISATDPLLLAGRRTLRSFHEEQVIRDGPAYYWPLGDPSGATFAAEATGKGGAELTPRFKGPDGAVDFGGGTGPGIDGMAAAAFASGNRDTNMAWLEGTVKPLVPAGANDTVVYELAFATSAARTGNAMGLLGAEHPSPAMFAMGLHLDVNNGNLVARWVTEDAGVYTKQSITAAQDYWDGATHLVTFVISDNTGSNQSTGTLYVDNVQRATSTVSGLHQDAVGLARALRIGWAEGRAADATISHVAAFLTTAWGTTEVGNHYNAMNGWAGQHVGTRAQKIVVDCWGWPLTSVETGLSTLAEQATSGQSVTAALELAADSEDGFVFCDGQGRVVVHNRKHRLRAGNWCGNGTFEVNTAGWVASGGSPPTLARDTAQKHSGAASMKITWATDGFPAAVFSAAGLTIGSPYRVSAWLRVPTGDANTGLSMAGMGLGVASSLHDVFEYLELDWFATATTHDIIVYQFNSVAGDITWVDDVAVIELPQVNLEAHQLDPGFRMEWDPQHVRNRWTVNKQGGAGAGTAAGGTFTAYDQASIDDHGEQTEDTDVVLAQADLPYRAQAGINTFSTLRRRASNVKVSGTTDPGLLPSLLSVELGDMLWINNHPDSPTAPIALDVEGFTAELNVDGVAVDFETSPRPIGSSKAWLVLDTANDKLDQNVLGW